MGRRKTNPEHGITIHQDIWSGLRPFVVDTSTHLGVTICCILDLSITFLLIWVILSIIRVITGDVPIIIEYFIYVADASSIIGYSVYVFWHRKKSLSY